MSTGSQQARNFISRNLPNSAVADLRQRLSPKYANLPPRAPGGTQISSERLDTRWAALSAAAESREVLADPKSVDQMEIFSRNIENYVGTLKVPVGVAGPLRVNGLFAQGDYYIPLATTEAALVASFDRGARLLSEAGGCSVMLLNEGITRAPGFAFRTLAEAGEFVLWAMKETDALRKVAESTTHHGRLLDVRLTVEGNHVYLQLEFTTGGAAGQNMVTIATDLVCRYILEHSPVMPEYWFVEANLSGDKKASVLSFITVRGRKVTAEAHLPAELVRRRLHTTAARMVDYWRMSALGGVMSGTIGVHGHYANGISALYLACGQDAACVAESAVGVTRFELAADGELYAAVTLPNIIVGTVGGGAGLPSQRACLDILRLTRPEDAPALAEVCAAVALAGELSIIGAMAAQEFTRAHSRRARGRAEHVVKNH